MWNIGRLVIIGLAWACALAAWAQAPAVPRYRNMILDTPPVIREGRAFVPVRAIAQQLGAMVAWQPETRAVRITRPSAPVIVLAIGSRTAQVGESALTLDAAPFVSQGRTMVPLRAIAEGFNVPIRYDARTRSVHLTQDGMVNVLTLESLRAGIVLYDPRPNMLIRNPVLVQGQANVYEGNVTIEVRSNTGQVLGRTQATAGMGGFYAFSESIYYNLPSEDPITGRVVAYSADGRGDGRVLASASVPVRIASTR